MQAPTPAQERRDKMQYIETEQNTYEMELAIVKFGLEHHGYEPTIEMGGGGMLILTAPAFTTPNGRKTQILFAGYAYTGLTLQVEDAEGYYEAEPWCPAVDFGEHPATGSLTLLRSFLDEVEALGALA